MKSQWIAPAMLWAASAMAQPAPNVQVELRDIDPAYAQSVPPGTQVYGHIVYTTDAPVRLVLVPYRNGKRVEGYTNSGSPRYAPGSGETIAWFSFDTPQTIDEVRAVANDSWEKVYAEDVIVRNITWREGAPATAQADWVEPLQQAEKNVVIEPPPEYGPFAIFIGAIFVPLLFLLVPLSVGLQIYAWRKLDGKRGQFARWSGFAMAALWLFVIVTAMAGSNLSPIWVVFLSPVFVLFLGGLLVAQARARAR